MGVDLCLWVDCAGWDIGERSVQFDHSCCRQHLLDWVGVLMFQGRCCFLVQGVDNCLVEVGVDRFVDCSMDCFSVGEQGVDVRVYCGYCGWLGLVVVVAKHVVVGFDCCCSLTMRCFGKCMGEELRLERVVGVE